MIQDTIECCDYTVYKHAKEIVPDDEPPSKGKRVTVTSHLDTNSMHNVLFCKACTGILHLLNGVPIEASSKKKLMLEMATYGSEFMWF